MEIPGLINNYIIEYNVFNNHNNNNNHFILGTFRFLPRRCASAARSLHPTTGELNHALSQVPATTLPQLSRPMSSGHHICMEHRLRRKPPKGAGLNRAGPEQTGPGRYRAIWQILMVIESKNRKGKQNEKIKESKTNVKAKQQQ